MKNQCNKFTQEQIGMFVDNELDQDLSHAIQEHQKNCPDCKALIEEYKGLSEMFSSHADQQVSLINPERLKQKLEHVANRKNNNSIWSPGTFLGKNIYLKLASIAAILVISLVAFTTRLSGPAGPSAIVNSVDADVASVMIIETEKQKHTIIWFSET